MHADGEPAPRVAGMAPHGFVVGVTDLGTVLGVWAHPDDETYLSGGLMALARDLGQRVACVTATRGEHGTADPVAWPPGRLAPHRARELRAALGVLGVHEHHWLGYEDGTLASVDAAEGAARIGAIVTAIAPDTIVSFGPDGVTGHPDHRAIAAWTEQAWRESAPSARLLQATTTAGYADRFARLHAQVPIFDEGFPRRTAERDLALRLALDGTILDRKVAALRAHASQTDPLLSLLGPDEYRAWVAEEAFVEAAPFDGPVPRP